jgi:hypothetical protein
MWTLKDLPKFVYACIHILTRTCMCVCSTAKFKIWEIEKVACIHVKHALTGTCMYVCRMTKVTIWAIEKVACIHVQHALTGAYMYVCRMAKVTIRAIEKVATPFRAFLPFAAATLRHESESSLNIRTQTHGVGLALVSPLYLRLRIGLMVSPLYLRLRIGLMILRTDRQSRSASSVTVTYKCCKTEVGGAPFFFGKGNCYTYLG